MEPHPWTDLRMSQRTRQGWRSLCCCSTVWWCHSRPRTAEIFSCLCPVSSDKGLNKLCCHWKSTLFKWSASRRFRNSLYVHFSWVEKFIQRLKKLLITGTSNDFHSESSESQHKIARLAIEIDDSKDLFEEFITPWLICSGIYLYEHDKSILRSDKLSDCHIDFAQVYIKETVSFDCWIDVNSFNVCN